MYGPKGKRIFTLDTSRIKEFLDISDDCVTRLSKVFCPPDYVLRRPEPRNRVEYPVLAAEYMRLIASGECKDRADVARRFGVSRAWVTKVIKRMEHTVPVGSKLG
jgi:hypothetical protein